MLPDILKTKLQRKIWRSRTPRADAPDVRILYRDTAKDNLKHLKLLQTLREGIATLSMLTSEASLFELLEAVSRARLELEDAYARCTELLDHQAKLERRIEFLSSLVVPADRVEAMFELARSSKAVLDDAALEELEALATKLKVRDVFYLPFYAYTTVGEGYGNISAMQQLSPGAADVPDEDDVYSLLDERLNNSKSLYVSPATTTARYAHDNAP